MTTQSSPFPKPLWDALENVFSVKSRDLIKDIAKTLNQSEKPLLEAFKAKKHQFHLVDLSDPTDGKFQCEALLCTSAVAHRCRKPVVFGQKVCPEHEVSTNPIIGTKPVLDRLITNEGETYFVDQSSNVFTKELTLVGRYTDGQLTIFEIDEEEEFA
jgi:hypothetical protein